MKQDDSSHLDTWQNEYRAEHGRTMWLGIDQETRQLHRWTGEVWENVEDEIGRLLYREAGIDLGASSLREIKQQAVNRSQLIDGDKHELGGGDPWINFRNGVYHVNTGDLVPHGDIWPTVNQIPWELDPDWKESDTEALDGFLRERAGDENAAFLWELIGSALLPGNPREHIYVLTGPGGSGKGTFLNVLKKAVGKSNRATLAPRQLNDRFAARYLHGSLINVAGDVNGGVIKGYETILGVSGGDEIMADVKFGPAGMFTWDGILLLATNGTLTPPGTAGVHSGWWRRAQTIGFPHALGEQGQIPKAMLERQVFPDEAMSAIVSRGAMLLTDRLREGKEPLEPTDAMREAAYEIQASGSATRGWAEDRLKASTDHRIKEGNVFYDDFKDWCAIYGREKMSAQRFYRELADVLPDLFPGAHRLPGRRTASRAPFVGVELDRSVVLDRRGLARSTPWDPNYRPETKEDLSAWRKRVS